MRNVTGIEISGNDITFKLANPSAAFLTASLARINLIPKHVWEPGIEERKTKETNAESYQEPTPVGSGPFKFVSWTANEEVVLAAAVADPNLKVVSTVDIGFRHVAFNHRRPPFDDPAFRNALSAVVDRRLIAGAAFRGFAVPSNSVVSPALAFWYNEETDKLDTGIDKARAMLEAAGCKVVDGKLNDPAGVTETLK